jgi:ribonuclease VapC
MGRWKLKAVVDASVAIAFLLRELGGDHFSAAIIAGSFMNDVNRAEVVRRQMRDGVALEIAIKVATEMGLEQVPFDQSLFSLLGLMFPHERKANLSLADCICLATAKQLGLPALTADRSWKDVESDIGVEVILIR